MANGCGDRHPLQPCSEDNSWDTNHCRWNDIGGNNQQQPCLGPEGQSCHGTGRVKDKMDGIYGIEGIARFETEDTVKILTAKGIVGRRSSQIPEMQNTGQQQLVRTSVIAADL